MEYPFWKISRRGWKPENTAEIEKVKDAYDNAIRYADKFIARLWEDLEKEDSIFFIHADHEYCFGKHGFYRHPLLLYEELIHVPSFSL